VGILNGKAMGVVEVVPDSGVFDYASKYTKGRTRYLAPAPLTAELTAAAQQAAESAFAACGCRDYARIDFMISDQAELFLLEINTLPGMKETSLLPMSARCAGLDFTALVRELVAPALRRFQGGGAV
jgi:D-alanine-D-alanine ligase